jgi:hypothetical protein
MYDAEPSATALWRSDGGARISTMCLRPSSLLTRAPVLTGVCCEC